MINKNFTEREIEILKLVAEGLTNNEIGEKLFISSHTVHAHISAIAEKLGANSRTQAAVIAIRAGIIS